MKKTEKKIKNSYAIRHRFQEATRKNFRSSLFFGLCCLLLLSPLHANFRLAEKAFQEKLYNFSAEYYRKTLATQGRQSQAKEIEKSYYRLALSLFFAKEENKAERRFSEYLNKYPNGNYRLAAAYFKAFILKEQAKNQLAIQIAEEELLAFKKKVESRKQTFSNHIQAFLRLLIFTTEIKTNETHANTPAREKATEAIAFLETYIEWLETKQAVFPPKSKNAIALQKALLELQPSKAAVLFKLERKKEALALYEAIYLNSNFSTLSFYEPREIRLSLLRLYVETKRYTKAEQLLKGSLASSENKDELDELRFLESHLSYLKGEFAKAIARYKNYLQKETLRAGQNPYYLEASFYLAKSYEKVGQNILALKTLLDIITNPLFEAEHNKFRILAYGLYQQQNDRDGMHTLAEAILASASNNADFKFALEKKIELLSSQERGEFPEIKPDYLEKKIRSLLARYKNYAPSSQEKSALYKKTAALLYRGDWKELSQIYFLKSYETGLDDQGGLAAVETLTELNRYPEALNLAKKIEGKLASTSTSALTGKTYTLEQAYLEDLIAFIYLQQKKYSEAMKRYAANIVLSQEKTMQGKPLSLWHELRLDAFFYLAEIQRINKDFDKALATYQQTANLAKQLLARPKQTEHAASLSNLDDNLLSPETADAHTKFQKRLFQTLLGMAKIYDFIKNDYAMASQLYTRALVYGNFAEANNLRFVLARTYLKNDQPSSALQVLKEIPSKAGDVYYKALLLLAKTASDENNFNLSFSYYLEIINKENDTENPPSSEVLEKAYFERIVLNAKKGIPREAYYYLGKLLALFPTSTFLQEGYLLTADTFLKKKDFSNAARVFAEVANLSLSTAPKNVITAINAYFRSASAYASIQGNKPENQEQASRYFLKSIRTAEQNNSLTLRYLEALFELAILEGDRGNLRQAQTYFRKVVTTQNKVSQTYPKEQELIQDLAQKAEENLEKILLYQTESPFEGLDAEAIKKKILLYRSPEVKAEGAERVLRIYIEENKLPAAIEYLQYAQSLWPISTSLSHELMNKLLATQQYKELYQLSLQYFLEDKFANNPLFQEYLYYAAALSAKKLNKKQDGLRFQEKLKTDFPSSNFLAKLK